MEVYEEINSYLVTCKLYVAHTSKFEFIAQKKQQLKLNLEHFCVWIVCGCLGGHININLHQTLDICLLLPYSGLRNIKATNGVLVRQ